MRILVAEDDRVQRRFLTALLQKWGHQVVIAANGSEAWAALNSETPPLLAILDWIMPGKDGLRICRELRQASDRPYVYVVLLTGNGEKHDLLQAFDAGADDFLAKPFDAQELRVRLQTGIRILELQEQLVFASTRDALTGVLNRGALMSALERELARVGRESGPLGIILADLDHFKRVNDELGHLAGDAVIREAALHMRAGLRPYDFIGRYGGEEFLMIFPGLSVPALRERAEQIRIQASRTLRLPHGEVPIRLSLGVSVTHSQIPAEQLIHAADDALYRAKQNGRNRTEVSSDFCTGPFQWLQDSPVLLRDFRQLGDAHRT